MNKISHRLYETEARWQWIQFECYKGNQSYGFIPYPRWAIKGMSKQGNLSSRSYFAFFLVVNSKNMEILGMFDKNVQRECLIKLWLCTIQHQTKLWGMEFLLKASDKNFIEIGGELSSWFLWFNLLDQCKHWFTHLLLNIYPEFAQLLGRFR